MFSGQTHPWDSAETPDLRIIPNELIVEHEYNDNSRTTPLIKRLEAEGKLKNPPIVTPLPDGDTRFVVLDGANRTTALHLMGYPYTLAQVVRYEPPSVTLTTWHHIVSRMDTGEFARALSLVPGVDFRPADLLHARAGLARREFLVYVILNDGLVFAARTSAPRRDVHETNRLLNDVVNTYKCCSLHRAITDSIQEALALFPDLAGMVIFPKYEPAEVLTLARDGELLPTGLTRHLIQGRALRINYPLSELKSPTSLEEKNARLQEWLRMKLSSKEARFYGEMTYLFDE